MSKSKKKRKRKPLHPTGIDWLPKPHNARFNRVSGEPTILSMTAFANDYTVSGSEIVVCCNCSSEHFYTYSLYRSKGQFNLVRRAYALPEKKRRKSKKGKKQK